MAQKPVTELNHSDLGKNVVIEEANGDRNSGALKSVLHSQTWVQVRIDNATIDSQLDATVKFED